VSETTVVRVESTSGANERWKASGPDAGEAACSLWWSPDRIFSGRHFGCVGEFSASSDRAAALLLTSACERLSSAGCAFAIGPMDGSTWHTYRFVTEPGTEPAFFLEPENHASAPQQFRNAGFLPLAHYVSALDLGLSIRDEPTEVAECRFERAGVRIRPLDVARFADESRSIYRVSIAAFKNNFLYSPVDELEFTATYAPIQKYVDPSIAFMAERRDGAVGFVFALPDRSRPNASVPETAIIKTLARLPDDDLRGLGAVLLERCRRAAFERGYVRGIHALMHDANASVALSGRFGSIMRGYTLFARAL
jgi:GNAT superfamily N-acetyltransferase